MSAKQTACAAIDVGSSGALVIYDGRDTFAFGWDASRWREALRIAKPSVIAVEHVSGGTLSSAKAFAFGAYYGQQREIAEATGAQIIDVRPTVWQAPWREQLPRGDAAYAQRKSKLHDIALEMFPTVPIFKYAADAFLIMYWLRNYHTQ
jgi:hypothetical protein